jgi:hypothetical protein
VIRVFYLLFFLAFCVSFSFSQDGLISVQVDTLKADYRTAGKGLDSIDIRLSEKHTTLPGGFLFHPFGKYGAEYGFVFHSLVNQNRPIEFTSIKYTGLPHVGMAYSFGSVGLQYLTTEYQQSFSRNSHLNILYQRSVNTGSFRYSGTANNTLTAKFYHNGNVLKHLVEIESINSYRSLNGGTSSDSIINNYGLEYASVLKQNSSDSIKRVNFSMQQMLKLVGNDTSQIGLYTKNSLLINKRVYREIDSLTKFYLNVDDADTTRDLTQLSKLENGVGIYAKSQQVKLSILCNRSYWYYKTQASQYKTEYDLQAKVVFNFRRFKVDYNQYQNFVGAKNQGSQSLHIVQSNPLFSQELNLINSYLLPNPMQRIYYSNTIDWQLPSSMSLQKNRGVNYKVSYNKIFPTTFSIGYVSKKNNYFFLDEKWRNDTLQLVGLVYFDASIKFNLGNFYLQPRFMYNHIQGVSSIVPKYDIRGRFYWNKKMEKKKNIALLMGADFIYRSSYSLMSYDTRVSLYTLGNSTHTSREGTSIDAFVSLAIDEIRFYFKYENIDYFFGNKTSLIAVNYPATPTILRLGLTWDFFN